MRVTHFIHTFSKLSETFIYDYLTSLQEQEVDVEVVTFNHLNTKERPFEPVQELTLPWWNIPRIWNFVRDKILQRKTETSAWPIYQKKLKIMFSNKRPDILHAHFGPMGVLLTPVAKELNIPLVVTFYGYDISQNIREKFWLDAYQKLAGQVSFVTVLSEEMKERALKVGFSEDHIKVVHLGTRVKEITYDVPSCPITNFLSVGRLAEKKGHLDTIQAFQKVLENCDRPLKLQIIGDGEDRSKLASYILENRLQDHVVLLGRMSHEKVVEKMQSVDAFILNSKTASNGDKEGTPTVLIEAQAVGLPCISTFHSGIPEIIPNENHRFLAEEGNISQIISNMEKLLTASGEVINKISRLGREKVEREFDVSGEASKFKKLYNELLN